LTLSGEIDPMLTLPIARIERMRLRKRQVLCLSAALLLAQAPFSVRSAAAVEGREKVQPTAEKTQTASGSAKDMKGKLLQGSVIHEVDRSPLLDGVVQTIPPGVDVNLSLNCFLNSEVSQKGDEIYAKVSVDVKDGSKVMLPEGWYLRGLVTDATGQRRHSRDGYIEVTFDKLVSPKGDIELAFPAKFSTKDHALKSVAKVAMIDTAIVTKNALKGGLLGLKMGGIPVAIASYGIVPGTTAAIGAGYGAIKAARRPGEIRSITPGDVIQLKTVEPISLPGFNVKALPSYQKAPPVRGAVININKCWFMPDVRDKKAQLLKVDFTFVNETKSQYSFRDFVVTTNLGQMYFPELLSPANYAQFKKRIPPNMQEQGIVTFNIDKGKSEYYLILIDHTNKELCRALIK
jgi:hypothetical protein